VFLLLFILTENGFLLCGSGTTIRHNTQHTSHKITHHPQTKHSTHSTKKIKDTTHNAYNANTIIISLGNVFSTTNRLTLQETDYFSPTKPNPLMLFRKTVAVYSENRAKHIHSVGRMRRFAC
jgi:hypothetical protein